MRLFVDVDALCKCAHWGILDHLPELLGFDWTDSATLSSLKFRANRAQQTPDGKLFRTNAAASAACQTIEKMQSNLDPDAELLAEIDGVAGIDPGEAILFSAAANNENIYILTGDKRALRSLAKLTESANVRQLHRKFICIEMLILKLLDQHGLDWVRNKICPFKDIDKAVIVILGSRCDADENSVREALAAYINELHRDCINFLIP